MQLHSNPVTTNFVPYIFLIRHQQTIQVNANISRHKEQFLEHGSASMKFLQVCRRCFFFFFLHFQICLSRYVSPKTVAEVSLLFQYHCWHSLKMRLGASDGSADSSDSTHTTHSRYLVQGSLLQWRKSVVRSFQYEAIVLTVHNLTRFMTSDG